MSRRKKSNDGTIALVIVGLLLFLGIQRVQTLSTFMFLILVLPAALLVYKAGEKKRRIEHLRAKYGDENVVQRILARELWRGQTLEQLCDALGDPVVIDQKIMATRDRQVWKYGQKGVNRFELRVTLDDQIVAGWEKR